MNIEEIANELLSIKQQLEELESNYYSKRDQMFNCLSNASSSSYEYGGYKFQKTEPVTVLSVNKQNFMQALRDAGIDETVRHTIMTNSLSESIRESGIRITKLSK